MGAGDGGDDGVCVRVEVVEARPDSGSPDAVADDEADSEAGTGTVADAVVSVTITPTIPNTAIPHSTPAPASSTSSSSSSASVFVDDGCADGFVSFELLLQALRRPCELSEDEFFALMDRVGVSDGWVGDRVREEMGKMHSN